VHAALRMPADAADSLHGCEPGCASLTNRSYDGDPVNRCDRMPKPFDRFAIARIRSVVFNHCGFVAACSQCVRNTAACAEPDAAND
jgi:hypothetical protein